MNPSVNWCTWIVKCDTSLSDAREVFSPDDDCVSAHNPFDKSPLARAFAFARFHADECRADVPERMWSGTIEVFARDYRETTRRVIYISDPLS